MPVFDLQSIFICLFAKTCQALPECPGLRKDGLGLIVNVGRAISEAEVNDVKQEHEVQTIVR